VIAPQALLLELLLRLVPGLLVCTTRSNAIRGRAGERLAARYLRRLGHRILARNLRHPRGELDLVTRTRTHLVLVEVKTGIPGMLPLSKRFTPNARARRRLAAAELARRYGLLPRLDLVEVRLSRDCVAPRMRHLTGL